MSAMVEEKQRLESLITDLEGKSMSEHHENIMIFLECHDPAKYRKKIKGFHNAFNATDKSRIDKDDTSRKYKFKPIINPSELRHTME